MQLAPRIRAVAPVPDVCLEALARAASALLDLDTPGSAVDGAAVALAGGARAAAGRARGAGGERGEDGGGGDS
jgi:hypothetical protein